MILRNPDRRRGGATTVEVAVVVSVFLLFLFGLFEYCRFLLMHHVATNAARDAARYAVVNINKPATFHTTDVGTPVGDVTRPNPATGYYPSVVRYAHGRLASNDKMIRAYGNESPTPLSPTTFYNSGGSAAGTALCQIDVFPCDPAALNASPPQVQPKAGVAWNQAVFGERIAVRVWGTYVPVLPSFLFMGNTIEMKVAITMGSEG